MTGRASELASKESGVSVSVLCRFCDGFVLGLEERKVR